MGVKPIHPPFKSFEERWAWIIANMPKWELPADRVACAALGRLPKTRG